MGIQKLLKTSRLDLRFSANDEQAALDTKQQPKQ